MIRTGANKEGNGAWPFSVARSYGQSVEIRLQKAKAGRRTDGQTDCLLSMTRAHRKFEAPPRNKLWTWTRTRKVGDSTTKRHQWKGQLLLSRP